MRKWYNTIKVNSKRDDRWSMHSGTVGNFYFFMPKFNNLWKGSPILTRFFLKCWLLVWLLRWLCAGLGNQKLSCWGCPKGKWGGSSLDFSKKINETYKFFSIFRLRGLHLTCSVKERSWRFFDGSIDTMEYLWIFHYEFVFF
jgi:hypothetical protein